MITTNGHNQLLKLVSGKAHRFADQFAVGVSSAELTEDASQLGFGWATCPVTDSYVDQEKGTVVFHGTLPAEAEGDIWEIGLISQSSDFINTGIPNAIVYGFEPAEAWVSDVEYEVVNTGSVGRSSYVLPEVEPGNFLAKIVSGVNVSRYDTLQVRIGSTGTATLRVTFKNDEFNFSRGTLDLTEGMNSLSINISSFTKSGAFDPRNISEIRFEVQSGSGIDIEFDAMSLSSKENGGLVARDVLPEVMYKRAGATMELEYAVRFNDGSN